MQFHLCNKNEWFILQKPKSLNILSETHEWFKRLSVVEDVELLFDSKKREVLILPHHQNMGFFKSFFQYSLNKLKKPHCCNIYTQTSIGRVMTAIMSPNQPETPYKSWQTIKEELNENHTGVREQFGLKNSIHYRFSSTCNFS